MHQAVCQAEAALPPQTAELLLACYGDDADLYALERYNEQVIAGDVEGCLTWRWVVWLVSEALRLKRAGR